VTGSNRRPSRCKRWNPRPSCVSHASYRPRFGLFGSVFVRIGGSR
jgi:hypothetical protein